MRRTFSLIAALAACLLIVAATGCGFAIHGFAIPGVGIGSAAASTRSDRERAGCERGDQAEGASHGSDPPGVGRHDPISPAPPERQRCVC